MNYHSCKEKKKCGGIKTGLEKQLWDPCRPLQTPADPRLALTYRKALYIGRYQQTKEQGVKRRSQSMDNPKPDPLLVSTQNLARQARKFRTRAKVLPEGRGTG